MGTTYIVQIETTGEKIFVTEDELALTVTDEVGSTFTELGDGAYLRHRPDGYKHLIWLVGDLNGDDPSLAGKSIF